MGRLAGRVAVITGAGRGIGAATARLFAAEGAAVALNDRDAEPLQDTAAQIRGAGGRVIAVPGSCADPVVAAELAERAVAELGTIDIVVTSAGSEVDAPFHTAPQDAWDTVDRDLVRSAVAGIRACLVELRGRAQDELALDGRVHHQRKVVLTTAASYLTGSPGQANLTAAAGALVGLTRTLARELGGFGINVNAVAPGFVETRLTAPQGSDDPHGVAMPIRQMAKAMTALGRYGTPEDVARAHLFLASADADFITGITLPVTGGMLGTCL